MNILLVAGVWLVLGVTFCLVSGRGIAIADAATREPSETPAAPAEAAAPAVPVMPVVSREFTTLAVHEWARNAANVATDELLSTRPGAIRRVAAT